MEYNPYALTGKTILVTGASSGIGRAVAIECSRLGAHVILSARNKEKLEETLKMMEGHGHQVIECDLSKEKEVSLLIDEVPEIQGLVNNAGTTMTVPVPFIKFNVLSDLLKVNTIAPIMILSGLVKKKKLRANSSNDFIIKNSKCYNFMFYYFLEKNTLSFIRKCNFFQRFCIAIS